MFSETVREKGKLMCTTLVYCQFKTDLSTVNPYIYSLSMKEIPLYCEIHEKYYF